MSKGIGGNCLEAISRTFREATGARGVLGALVARAMRLQVAWGLREEGLSENPETAVVWEVPGAWGRGGGGWSGSQPGRYYRQ